MTWSEVTPTTVSLYHLPTVATDPFNPGDICPLTWYSLFLAEATSEDFMSITEREYDTNNPVNRKEFDPENMIGEINLDMTVNFKDPKSIDNALHSAIQEAKQVAEAAYEKALKEVIKQTKLSTHSKKYLQSIESSEYRRGLFCTALRKATTFLRDSASGHLGSYLDTFWKTENWRDLAVPHSSYRIEANFQLVTNVYWRIDYTKIVSMCTNTWIPEEEEMIEEQTQEVKISNSIDGLAGLIKKIEDASASINKVTLSLKDIGKEAEIQKEKIYA